MNSGLAGTEPNSQLERGIIQLRASGKKITHARVALLAQLLKRTEPATIEEIHRDIDAGAFCDPITIYRSLAVYEDLGMVRRGYTFEGVSTWQYLPETDPPYRVISKLTADSDSLDPELCSVLRLALENVERVLKTKGYKDVGHRAHFFALRPEDSKVPTSESSRRATASRR
jgi:Fur family ferric uptake transcriptional regulator